MRVNGEDRWSNGGEHASSSIQFHSSPSSKHFKLYTRKLFPVTTFGLSHFRMVSYLSLFLNFEICNFLKHFELTFTEFGEFAFVTFANILSTQKFWRMNTEFYR